MDNAWQPGPLTPDRPAYVALADAIAADLARDRLAVGDRLPTHRALARALGVTIGTVARGYAEAERRGLVSGEVGRGTFVRGGFGIGTTGSGPADLAALHPPIGGGLVPAELLGATLGELAADPLALAAVTDTERSADAPAHRAAAARWVAHGSFAPDPDRVLLTAGAQHALSLALLALVPSGGAVATTPLTNPGLVAAARQLGVRLVVVPDDEEGMRPDLLEQACAERDVAVVHLQTTLANPTGRTTPAPRRAELAEACRRRDVWILEDDPLAFLAPDRPDPVAALAPERTCHVASAAKVLALGLRVGVLSAPEAAYPRLAAALRSSTWLTAPLLGEVLARWVRDGTADRVVRARVEATRARHGLARQLLADLDVVGEPSSPHLWLPLPEPWSTGSFVAAAREAEVLVAPGDDFVTGRSEAAFGVRLGLNAEVDDAGLTAAMVALVGVLRAGPSPS